MTLELTRIYRHPVKGLTPEALDRVELNQGEGLPHDRRFALAHGTTAFDPAAPAWMAKTNFLMLMRNERLAGLRTRYDDATGLLTIEKDGKMLVSGSLSTPPGRSAIERFFAAYMGEEARGAPRLVEAPGHMFSDTARKVASIIGLASVRELEQTLGAQIDPRRFRANLYFQGGAPWEEFGWIGREISVGRVRMKVVKRIVRCPATNVDPESGARDLDIPAALRRHFGHVDMGIYADVLEPGSIAIGDAITPPSQDRGMA